MQQEPDVFFFDLSQLPDQPEEKSPTSFEFDLSQLPDQPDPIERQALQGLKEQAITSLDDDESQDPLVREWGQWLDPPQQEFSVEDLPGSKIQAWTPEQHLEDELHKADMFHKYLTGGEIDPVKAAMYMGLYENIGLSPSTAESNFKHLTDQLTTRDKVSNFMKATTVGFIGGELLAGAALAGPVGVLAAIGQTGVGIFGYEVYSEAKRQVGGRLRQWSTGEDYTPFEFGQLVEGDQHELLGATLDLVDMLPGLYGAVGANKAVAKYGAPMWEKHGAPIWERFTKIVTEDLTPVKTVFISSEKIRDIFQTGEKISLEEMDMLQGLGLTGEQYRDAIKFGLDIEIPVYKLVTIADRPFYAKLKSLIKLSPYSEVTLSKGIPKAKRHVGLLPETTTEQLASGGSDILPAQESRRDATSVLSSEVDSAGRMPASPVTGKAKAQPQSTISALYQTMADQAAAKFRPDDPEFSALVKSVIRAESTGKPEAVSPKGASGLMQLMPVTAKEMGVTNSADPQQNIEGGTKYLAGLLDKYKGDKVRALVGYNWGPKRADTWDGKMESLPKETRDYVGKVLYQTAVEPMTREKYSQFLEKTPGISRDEAYDVMAIADARAEHWADVYKSTPEEFWEKNYGAFEQGGTGISKTMSQAAMYRSPKTDVVDFVRGILGGEQAKKAFFEYGNVPSTTAALVTEKTGINIEKASLVLPSDIVQHVNNRHPDITPEQWKELPSIISQPDDAFKTIEDKSSYGGSPIGLVSYREGKGIVVIAEHVSGKKGERLVVKTFFTDSEVGIRNWVEKVKAGTIEPIEGGLGAAAVGTMPKPRPVGEDVTPDTPSGENILPGEGEVNLPTLDQRSKEIRRGAIRFLEDNRAIINHFKSANVSTAVHELGHSYIEQLKGEALVNEEAAIHLANIEEWAGVENGEWTTENHEKAARGFEAFLFEGRAPTSKLRAVFQRFKDWMLRLYKSIKNLNVELNDSVRQAFDFMLSTAAERKNDPIRQMNDEYFGIEIPKDAIPLEAITHWDQIMAEASRRALLKVDADLEAARKKQEGKWYKEALEIMKTDPVQSAIDYFIVKGGLKRDLLLEDYDMDTIKEIRRGVVSSKGTLVPDVVAADLGFESVDNMVQALVNAPSRLDWIEGYVKTLREEAKPDNDVYDADINLKIIEAEIEILKELTEGTTVKMVNPTDRTIKTEIRKTSGQIKVGESMVPESQALKAGIKKASVAARKAFSEGKKEGALQEKLKQQELTLKQREEAKARSKRVAIKKGLVALLEKKDMGSEYQDQLVNFLAQWGLIPSRKSGFRDDVESLSQFVKRLADSWEAILPASDLVDQLGHIPYKELTLDELTEIYEAAKQIAYLGKLKNELIAKEKRRNFEQVLTKVVRSIYENAKLDPSKMVPVGLLPSDRRLSPFKNFTKGLNAFHMDLVKPEFLFRALDGYVWDGACYEEIYKPFVDAENAELKLGSEVMLQLKEAFAPFKKELKQWSRQKITIPGMEQKFTKEEMIMVALNSGNSGNLKALARGNRIPDYQAQKFTNMLSPEEFALVNKIWDILESLWPYIAETEKKLTGTIPPKVSGRYFPMVWDRELSWRADEWAVLADNRDYFSNVYALPATRRGHTIKRKGGALPLLLSFNVIQGHIFNVIHRVTHEPAVRDAQKLISAPSFRAAVTDTYGDEAWRTMMPWVQHMARPFRPPLSEGERLLRTLRHNTTIVMLGLRASTALPQVVSLTQAFDEMGSFPTLKGLGMFLRHPWELKAFVDERCPYMANRSQSWDRDAKELFDNFNPKAFMGSSTVKDAYFSMITAMDALASYSTWLGAYHKSMNEMAIGDEAKAIDYAQMVVRTTQGSGSAKDMAAIQRGSELQKSLTMFYSFFNLFYNRMWNASSAWRAGKKSFIELMTAYWWLIMVPPIVNEMINKRRPLTPKEMGKSMVRYMLAGLPYVRDMAGPVLEGYPYAMSPMTEPFEAVINLLNAPTSHSHPAEKFAKASIEVVGYKYGLPSKQAIVTMQGILDFMDGKTNNPLRLLFPEAKERKRK